MRKLIVEKCSKCPFLERTGVFGGVSHIPICGKIVKELPYTIFIFHEEVVAHLVDEIPDWCPLEEDIK